MRVPAQLRMPTVEPGGAYFAALSRRLNRTCSNKTASSGSIGRSADRSTSTRCSERILLARCKAVPTISPISSGTSVRRHGAGFEARHVEEIGDEAVEPLGLVDDRRQRGPPSPPDRARPKGPAGPCPSRGSPARGVCRSCEIEVSSAERRRSGLGGRLAPVEVLDEMDPLDRQRRLIGQGIEEAALFRRQRRSRLVAVDADDADGAASRAQRQEQALRARQRVGAASRRAIVLPGPVAAARSASSSVSSGG